jgi:lactobin A/cerein 7B family class IIb bacteriocin
MKAEMKEMSMNELDLNEMEQVSGGWWPVIIAVAAAGYCFYKAYEKGKKSGWK